MGRQFGSLGILNRERVHLNAMRQRHGRIAALAKPHRLGRTRPVRPRSSRKAPQIVEADLRRRKLRKLRARLPVQIAQQPIAQPIVGHPTKLFFDELERPPQRRTSRQCLSNINPARIQPYREQAGEPSHRARKVDVRQHLLAPVTLHINQHRMVRPPPTPPTPLHNRQGKRSQQRMVDPGMERPSYPLEQRLRDRSR